jgi:hypothetical protein
MKVTISITEAAEILRCNDLLQAKFGITTDIVEAIMGCSTAGKRWKHLLQQANTLSEKFIP